MCELSRKRLAYVGGLELPDEPNDRGILEIRHVGARDQNASIVYNSNALNPVDKDAFIREPNHDLLHALDP